MAHKSVGAKCALAVTHRGNAPSKQSCAHIGPCLGAVPELVLSPKEASLQRIRTQLHAHTCIWHSPEARSPCWLCVVVWRVRTHKTGNILMWATLYTEFRCSFSPKECTFYSVMMFLWRNKWEAEKIKAFSLQWRNGKVVPTGRHKLKGWKRLGAFDDIHRGREGHQVGRETTASGEAFRRPDKFPWRAAQHCSLKAGLSVYVCAEQFKGNKTLQCNLSEGEEPWHDNDKTLLLDLTGCTAVWRQGDAG